MGKLISCPDCGRQVSKSAVQCPSCGHPFRASAKGKSSISCCGLISAAIFVAVVGFISEFLALTPKGNLPAPGQRPSPSSTPKIGDPVMLEVPGNARVYLATKDEAFDEMIDAQNANSWDLMNRLISQGKVVAPPNGTKGVLVNRRSCRSSYA